MNTITLKKSRSGKFSKVASIVSSAGFAFYGSCALAIDDTEVTAAYSAGNTSVDNAVTGLIALIAVVVGVNMVIGLLKKG